MTTEQTPWIAAAESNKILSDVLTVPDGRQQDLIDMLIRTSFFLPKEILEDKNYVISPIFCVKDTDFAMVYRLISFQEEVGIAKTHCDCAWELLAFAKFIGISCRRHRETGKLNVLFKLWYGNRPSTEKGFNTVYDRKLNALHKFVSTMPKDKEL